MDNKRVTLDDVARAAGVSRATASRALTGVGPASPDVRRRVRAAVEQLGFSPNQAARALASNRAHAVALVIPEPNSLVLGDPFLGGMISGVSEAFRDTDYQLILVIVRPDDEPAKAYRLLQSGVDGAIIASHHFTGQLEHEMERQTGPLVYVGRPWSVAGARHVDVDNALGGRLAAECLVARGAHRVACVAGPSDMTPVRDRLAGWERALGEAGVALGPVVHRPFTSTGGAEAMAELLAGDTTIDGVFAQSDLLAAGAVRVLQEQGRSVGDDVFVVGFDDSEVARTTTPRLTSVTNPSIELARRASRMLLRMLDEGADPAGIAPDIIEPHLVRRESA